NDMLIYWAVQLVGGAVAAFVVLFLKGTPATAPISIDIAKVFVAEFIFAFALCYVVLNVATAKGTEGNSFYGWAIGFTVLAGALAVGGVSGGACTPAVAIGGAFMNIFPWDNIWLYLVAELVAGAVAAVVFVFLHPD